MQHIWKTLSSIVLCIFTYVTRTFVPGTWPIVFICCSNEPHTLVVMTITLERTLLYGHCRRLYFSSHAAAMNRLSC